MIVAVTVAAPVTDEGESETDAPPSIEGESVSVPAPAASPALATNVTVADVAETAVTAKRSMTGVACAARPSMWTAMPLSTPLPSFVT